MVKTRVSPFEFQVLKRLKATNFDWANEKLLVAFSGGRDSVALLNILVNLKSRLKFELAVAHVHHGRSSSAKIDKYRKSAATFSRSFAENHDLKFHLLKHSGAELLNEADFRKVREAKLSSCLEEFSYTRMVFAHHLDDLLETRLIRLIRGTGPQGLKAMDVVHREKLRPLLSFGAEEVARYCDQQKLKWVEDPTNAQCDYLRNWIRNQWLRDLENKRPGAALALARSLEQIAEALPATPKLGANSAKSRPDVIFRKEFADLTLNKKREAVARVMLEQGARDFSRRQIDEILKRLSSSRSGKRGRMSFEIAGLHWQINAEQIEAVRLK